MTTLTRASVSTRARPARVAYLVDADASEHLSAAFADSFSRWGGRFSLCVPVTAGSISPQYLSWLTEFDPDVVEAFAPVENSMLTPIAKASNAFRFSLARSLNGRIKPEASSSFLTSLTALPHFVQQPLLPLWQGQRRYLLDGIPELSDNFILDNFGTPTTSFGSNLPSHLLEYSRSIFLTRSPHTIDQFVDRPTDLFVADELQFLRQLGEGPGVITLSQLASHRAFQLTWPNPQWTDNFTIVIGDSFVDRLCYWNSRLLAGSWSYSTATCMRLPVSRVKDPHFCQALASVLHSRVALGFHPSVQTIVIRSHSVPQVDLEVLCETLRKEMRTEFVYAQINDYHAVAPSGPRQDRVSYLEERESEKIVHLQKSDIELPMPLHIAANGEHMHGQDGEWLVDCKIGRERNYSRHSNSNHNWLLPRRPQPAHQFFPADEARIDYSNQFTVRTSLESRTKRLSIPDDNDVFRSLFLSHVSHYRHQDDLRRTGHSDPVPYEMRTGDKGQVLNGTIGLFGGLKGALNYLGMRFWRDYLLSLAAPNRDPDRLKNVTERLRQRVAGSSHASVALESDADWERLAKSTIEISGSIRVPRSFATVSSVTKAWCQELEKIALEKPQMLAHLTEQEQEEAVIESFKELRDLGVFAQGHKWRCGGCGYHNWTSVSGLSEQLRCAICKEEGNLPLGFEWDFRLNDFLATSLREYDSLSSISALGHLWLRAEKSFFFCVPTEFMMKRLPNWRRFVPDFEIDMICVVDGQLLMVESKESGRFRDDDLEKLSLAAKVLLPDKIVLTSLIGNPRLEARARKLAEAVKPLAIEVESIQGMPAEWVHPSLHLQW